MQTATNTTIRLTAAHLSTAEADGYKHATDCLDEDLYQKQVELDAQAADDGVAAPRATLRRSGYDNNHWDEAALNNAGSRALAKSFGLDDFTDEEARAWGEAYNRGVRRAVADWFASREAE